MKNNLTHKKDVYLFQNLYFPFQNYGIAFVTLIKYNFTTVRCLKAPILVVSGYHKGGENFL